jgi:cytochrome bd-type quinol oxidase subunit 2
MSIKIFALIFALINIVILLGIYWLLAMRRKSGKSDIQQSRITLVIASFVVPVVVCICFIITAVISQQFFNTPLPVGQRGGGVFIILITSVLSSIITLIALLPRIKHKWDE